MRHRHLQHQNFIKLDKLYCTLLKICAKVFLFQLQQYCKTNYFRKYDVINDDVITFALLCVAREKLDIIVSTTPAQS